MSKTQDPELKKELSDLRKGIENYEKTVEMQLGIILSGNIEAYKALSQRINALEKYLNIAYIDQPVKDEYPKYVKK